MPKGAANSCALFSSALFALVKSFAGGLLAAVHAAAVAALYANFSRFTEVVVIVAAFFYHAFDIGHIAPSFAFAAIMPRSAGAYASAAQRPDEEQQQRRRHQQRRAGEHGREQQHRRHYQQQIADAAIEYAAKSVFKIAHEIVGNFYHRRSYIFAVSLCAADRKSQD